MEIKSTFTNEAGDVLDVVYRDIESEAYFLDKDIHSVGAYCFCGDKFVVVFNSKSNSWTPPGGGVEKDESAHGAVVRELFEESNMKVLSHKFIGYQDIFEPPYIVSQIRSVCIVEPYGDFISDPGGDITEIKLIDPKDYKKYFDWGIVGDRIMDRAMELKAQLLSE